MEMLIAKLYIVRKMNIVHVCYTWIEMQIFGVDFS